MRKAPRTLVVAGALVALAFVATETKAERQLPAKISELIPAAKKEGAASIYGPVLNPDHVQTVTKAFNAFYGLNADLKITSGHHVARAAEMIQASRMGVKSGIDLLWTAAEVGSTLDKAQLIVPFAWTKEWNLPDDPALGPYGLRLYDASLSFVIYNTDLVKAADAPRTFKDLLNPKWKGRIVMPRDPGPFTYVSFALGETEATELVTGLLGPMDAKMLPRYPDVRARVLSGEFAVGIGVDSFAETRAGAPIAVAPIEPVVLVPWGAYLTKDAEHPALAKLFAYFAISPEGQKALNEVRGLALASSADTEIGRFVAGKRVVTAPYEFASGKGADYRTKLLDVMNIK